MKVSKKNVLLASIGIGLCCLVAPIAPIIVVVLIDVLDEFTPIIPTKTQKMLVPGKYRVCLAPGDYQLWQFFIWNSKSIKSPSENLPSIVITTAKGEQISQESTIQQVEQDYRSGSDPDRRGVMKSTFTIKDKGTYYVSCSSKQRYVVAIVPHDEVYLSVSSTWRFGGDGNDNGFLPESAKATTVIFADDCRKQ